MALQVIYEGTPASFPVQAFNFAAPIYWEAGMIGSVDATGKGVVFIPGTSTVAVGLLADRRSTHVGLANINFLPTNPGGYGDEALFNQPGYGNSLYGTNGGTNNIIPANTIPTTTLLLDETAANPNVNSRYVTMYIRGGEYATDQFDTTQTYVPGTLLYADNAVSGRITNQNTSGVVVGKCLQPVNGYGFLTFTLSLV